MSNPGISVADAVQRLNLLNMQQQQTALMGGLAAGGNGTGTTFGGSAGNLSMLTPAGGALTKHQREIYVGNLPPGVSIPQITDFLNVAMRKLGVTPSSPVGSVVSAWVSGDGHYSFIELRTVDEANTAMAYLSGLQIGPFTLKVGRPKASGPSGLTGKLVKLVVFSPSLTTAFFSVPMAATPFTAHMLGLGPDPGGPPLLGGFPMPEITTSAAQLGGLASVLGSSMPGMAEGPGGSEPASNTVMTLNIPLSLSEQQIRELMSPFGHVSDGSKHTVIISVCKCNSVVDKIVQYDPRRPWGCEVSDCNN